MAEGRERARSELGGEQTAERWGRARAGFSYRLTRLQPRASKSREPPAKVYNIFDAVLGLTEL